MKLQGNIINKALINLDKMKKVLLTLSLSIVASMGSFAQNEPYKNPKLTPEERAEDLLGRLTLKEKIGLMKNSSFSIFINNLLLQTEWKNFQGYSEDPL